MTLVFLDTETTGLELYHDIWEVAWAYEDGQVHSTIVPHSLKNADPEALRINGYFHRLERVRPVADDIDLSLRQTLEGATIVGANPAFDAMRLQLRWQTQPWHYRLLDISAMAVQAFGLTADGRPPGLRDVAESCGYFGEVPPPDHTAAGDVATTRACYKVLTTLRDFPLRWITGVKP